ncbi:MAG: S41 family peptidase [Bacteroidota bacterium]|nr:S41 family peptidase [Bacteroidota bacterium]
MPTRFLPLFIIPVFFSCSVSRNYNPNKKYSPEELRQDYSLLRNILEKKHPSLYWYTPKDAMNYFFDEGYKAISDSMTGLQFGWNILAPITSAIHCGHTSFSMSKGWNKFIKNKIIPSFPLYLKVWKDTMMVVANLNPNDSVIKKGNFITAINGIKSADMIDRMFGYLPQDGYSNNVNYIRLSMNFPYFHRNIFGLYKTYFVNYTDSNGIAKNYFLPYYAPSSDTLKKELKERKIEGRRIRYHEKLENIRSLEFDSSFALMTVNDFSKGHLTYFFKRSFRKLRKSKAQNLIIDLRTNGGGDINKSALLTKFLRNTSFKVADSAYSISKNLHHFTRYISSVFFDNIGLLFVTHKKKDGSYHFGFWERHTYMPKRKNHFNGHVYVLINGLTFSASTLFCNAVKGQQNITLAGEETGGGWYGNSGIMIPNITLPNTKLKVRLPFFRLVQYQHIAIKGTGVLPDVYIGTNWRDVLNGVDTKIKTVKRMIEERK